MISPASVAPSFTLVSRGASKVVRLKQPLDTFDGVVGLLSAPASWTFLLLSMLLDSIVVEQPSDRGASSCLSFRSPEEAVSCILLVDALATSSGLDSAISIDCFPASPLSFPGTT